MALVIPAPLHRYLRFGLGVGIVAEDHYLEIMVARAGAARCRTTLP